MSTSPSTMQSPRGREPIGDKNGTPKGQTKHSDRLLTINEVAAWLGVSKAGVYDHVTRKRPRLPCIRFGELTRFRRHEIERFIEEHVKPNGTPSA